MPRRSDLSIITRSDILAVKKNMKSHIGEQVTLISVNGSNETEKTCKISGVFDRVFTVESDNKRTMSYNHVDLILNHIKIIFGKRVTDVDKNKNGLKNVLIITNKPWDYWSEINWTNLVVVWNIFFIFNKQ